MEKCVYCHKRATDMDALGLPACTTHIHEADEYYEHRTGHKPSQDQFLYCEKHCDMWEPLCPRCEACSQHHYGKSVSEFLRSPESEIVFVAIAELGEVLGEFEGR